MTAPRKKPGVAFWATAVVVVALVAYPLSFGPACWFTSRVNLSGKFVTIPYRPIVWLFCNSPQGVRTVIRSYASAGAREDWGWQVKMQGRIPVDVEWGPRAITY